ncbi:MAG: LytTR family transcriptional regulator [Ferruginibacter sp.]|nr:LytTR family transcriptional regulator [Ferruginibacter sp.]
MELKKDESMTQNNSIILTTYYGKESINFDKILRIEAISNYSKLYFTDGKTLVVSKVLQWFEGQLLGGQFIRVHRSHLINSVYISEYNKKGKQVIILKDNSFFTVSRRKQTVVRRLLENAMTA